ncbi:hypothetical protein SAMN06265347_11143 [Halobellus salinus]|nr:hypothetical protein SAMN06265347_11143 [Halobellus salinus]
MNQGGKYSSPRLSKFGQLRSTTETPPKLLNVYFPKVYTDLFETLRLGSIDKIS